MLVACARSVGIASGASAAEHGAMFRPLAICIAWRLFKGARRERFLSLVSTTAFGAMALGVAVLIIVLSVMGALAESTQRRLLYALPHLSIETHDGNARDWRNLAATLSAMPDIVSATPMTQRQVLLRHRDGAVMSAELRGVSPGGEILLDEFKATKPLADASYGLVLSQQLARRLHAEPGDQITIMLPTLRASPFGPLPRQRRFQLRAVLAPGVAPGSELALARLEDVNRLLYLSTEPGVASGLRLALSEPMRSALVGQRIAATLTPDMRRVDWRETHGTTFRAMALERIAVSLMLLLVIVIATSNLASMLQLLVIEHRRSVALLRTLGATPRLLRLSFAVQGLFVSGGGIAVGALLSIALVQWAAVPPTSIASLPDVSASHTALILWLPARLQWSEVAVVVGGALLLSLPAVLLAARGLLSDIPDLEALNHAG